jgi:hypothetical protein
MTDVCAVLPTQGSRGPNGPWQACNRNLADISVVEGVFDEFRHLGRLLRASTHGGYRDSFLALGEVRHTHSWPAEVALAHGALSTPGSPLPEATMRVLERFVSPRTPKLFPRPI